MFNWIFNKDKNKNELCFTALGPRGSGKTTLLASIYKEFESKRPGTFYPSSGDERTFSVLNKAYQDLKEMANTPSGEKIERLVEHTTELREYVFTLLGNKKNSVHFFDFPGGWLNSESENYNRVIDIIKRSMVVLVAVNTPYIMEENGKFIEKAGIDKIQRCLLAGIQEDSNDKLILLVPIKCEKYTHTLEDSKVMRNKIMDAFSGMFTKMMLSISSNPKRKKSLAVALLPVHTVGNMQVEKFLKDEDERLVGIKLQKTGEKFSPKDIDQPMRFVMSFLINQYKSQSNKYWQKLLGTIFPSDKRKLEELVNFIKDDMRIDDDNFEIYCGKELIA